MLKTMVFCPLALTAIVLAIKILIALHIFPAF